MAYKLINARAETINEKPSFKSLIKNKRCIILADSFYEWKNEGKEKKPQRILMKNQNLFGFAGLYSQYIREDGSKLFTCTMITTEANTSIQSIHNRMPVILKPGDDITWLDPSIKEYEYLEHLLTPYPSDEMKHYPVSQIVNKATNESSECINPL